MIQKYYHAYTDNVDEYPETILEVLIFILYWKLKGKKNIIVDFEEFETNTDDIVYSKKVYAIGTIPD